MPQGTNVTEGYYRWSFHERFCGQRRPELFTAGVLILHDNVWPKILEPVSTVIENSSWESLLQSFFSPDKSPPDFALFPKLKKSLWGKYFLTVEEASNAVTQVLREMNKDRAQQHDIKSYMLNWLNRLLSTHCW